MTTMTTHAHPHTHTQTASHATQPSRRAWRDLLAACRLEDGARWALVGAAAATAILALLIF